MSDINLFKRRKKELNNLNLYSVATGELIPIRKVNDEVFSKKMLGDGYAVKPKDDNIYSPIKGEVVSVFPTKHAIGLKNDCGIEVLVHIGIDTVNLKGEPFEVFVKAGDIVDNNTLLATVNLNVLEEKEIISDVLVIITSDSYKNLEMFQYGQVEAGHIIGSLHLR